VDVGLCEKHLSFEALFHHLFEQVVEIRLFLNFALPWILLRRDDQIEISSGWNVNVGFILD
jgi:hypothetical protein